MSTETENQTEETNNAKPSVASKTAPHEELQYLNLCEKILDQGNILSGIRILIMIV